MKFSYHKGQPGACVTGSQNDRIRSNCRAGGRVYKGRDSHPIFQGRGDGFWPSGLSGYPASRHIASAFYRLFILSASGKKMEHVPSDRNHFSGGNLFETGRGPGLSGEKMKIKK